MKTASLSKLRVTSDRKVLHPAHGRQRLRLGIERVRKLEKTHVLHFAERVDQKSHGFRSGLVEGAVMARNELFTEPIDI